MINSFTALSILLDDTTTSTSSTWSTIILMVALFAIMYFVMIRPQRKKQKEEQAMRDAIQIGDEVTTIGGICGRVVTVKEDSLVIETGSDKNRMKITRWAIQTNNTAEDRLQSEREAQEAAKKAEKAEKGKGRRRSKKNADDEETQESLPENEE
ncbi:MAG: preprotein translocase subunit YajC [Clostridiales bacterium]|nr:preprotein translocase subunit YajC [Clostridiales bacterium]MCD7826915.1 preprotein translocase subunit YajC [Clostridiales bacterium]